MFNKLLGIRKEINEIKSLLSPLDFNKAHDDAWHKELQDAMNNTINHRNNVVRLVSTVNKDELADTISFIGKITHDDIGFKNLLFNFSLFRFCVYEIMLYCMSNILAMEEYELFYSIVTKNYYALGINDNTYSAVFGLDNMLACSIKEINGKNEDNAICTLINDRLDTSLSSYDELATCDMAIRDISVLNEDYYYYTYTAISYLTKYNIPKNGLLLLKMIQNNEPKIFRLFGFDTKGKLKDGIISCGQNNLVLLKVYSI